MKKLFIFFIALIALVGIACGIYLSIGRSSAPYDRPLKAGLYWSPPFVMKGKAGGKLTGFDVEILEAIARDQKLKIEYELVRFDDIFDLLNNGKLDMAPTLTILPEREKSISFTWPYNKIGLNILKRTQDDTINGVENLKGKKIAAFAGTSEEYCAKLAKKDATNQIIVYVDPPDAYKDLADGKIDAVIHDYPVNLHYAREYSGKLNHVGGLLTHEYNGIGVAKTNKRLQKILSQGLKNIVAKGEYSRIHAKYMGGGQLRKNSQSSMSSYRSRHDKIRVGVYILPPYCMKDDNGADYTGFDVEILKAIAKAQGLKVEFQQVPFRKLFKALNNGKIDVVPTLAIMPWRKKIIDFSWPFNEVGLQLMVQQSNHSIKKVDDLSDKVVASYPGTGEDYCRNLEYKGLVKKVEVFQENSQLYQELAKGNVDAVINDFPTNLYYQKSYNNSIHNVGPMLTHSYMGFGIRKGNAELKQCLNQGLQKIMAAGQYSKIYKKYMSEFGLPNCEQVQEEISAQYE